LNGYSQVGQGDAVFALFGVAGNQGQPAERFASLSGVPDLFADTSAPTASVSAWRGRYRCWMRRNSVIQVPAGVVARAAGVGRNASVITPSGRPAAAPPEATSGTGSFRLVMALRTAVVIWGAVSAITTFAPADLAAVTALAAPAGLVILRVVIFRPRPVSLNQASRDGIPEWHSHEFKW
jgi:hypothetical protein